VVAGPAVAALSAWLAALYAGTLALYTVVVLFTSVLLAVRARDLRLLPWLPLAFLAIHFGAGAGVLLEAVVGAKRPPAEVPVLSAEQMAA
jgi:hypothetical protein